MGLTGRDNEGMNVGSERDDLADELGELIHDSMFRNTGHAFTVGSARIADDLRAAGYRKPQVVTTQSELDTLPRGAVVAHTSPGDTYPELWMKSWESAHPRKDGTPLSRWVGGIDWDTEWETSVIGLPSTVIWTPAA